MHSILGRAPRALVMTAMALAVAACGGAGEDEDEPQWGDSGGSGGSGEVARVTYGTVPNYSASVSNVQIVAATNRGLYVTDENSQGGMRVHKLHGNPASGDWSSMDLGTVWPYTVVPTNRYSEADRVFSFYYAASSRVGQYNANTGGPATYLWTNDRYIRTIEPGPRQGTFTGPWGLGGSGNSDYNFVYHDDVSYTGSGAVSNMFTNPIGPSSTTNTIQAYYGIQGVLGRPDSPELFVATAALSGGGASELRVYSGSTMTREALPGGTSVSVSSLQWYDGKLWLRIGDRVYRRDGPGVFVSKAQVSLALGMLGSFCIKGGEIIGSDGYATRISDGNRRNYLSRGTLSASQSIQVALVQGSLGGAGVFCSPDNSASIIYTAGDSQHPGTVAMIEILQ
ncbi:MAG TPA: hypothetical protein VFL64_09915 [Rhizobacter sp.]|nr:hypothetical protein [Rhizobacter sp.]